MQLNFKLIMDFSIPIISVIVPCRNEEQYIARFLESIIVQDYRKENLEVLVVDGMSDDGTKGIIHKYTMTFPFIRLVENPRKITPCAMNTGIRNSHGEFILIMSAHSEYPPHFISECLEILNRTGADVVGGPVVTKPGDNTFIAESIALVISHPFGVGNSKFRTTSEEGYVDTVPFGMYRRSIFDQVGQFDERLARNQDNELSSRIIKSGYKIFLSPALTAQYYSRATLWGLIKQASKTGMWNVMTILINPSAFRWRHFIPFVFVMTLIISAALFPFSWCAIRIFLVSVGLYCSAAIISSLKISLKSGLKYFAALPGIFFLYHFFYGTGTLTGLLRMPLACLQLQKTIRK